MTQPIRDRKDHYVPQGYLRGFVDPLRASAARPLWCLNKARNGWERKAPMQICRAIGMYDFSDDAIKAEHADVTFKSLEDRFPSLRDELQRQQFKDWRDHINLLLRYMQMMRVRCPLYFLEQGYATAESFIGRVVSVDETRVDIRPFTLDDIHDFTLTKMREEFARGAEWMGDFHWQIRTTFDAHNPVVTSEQPLFVVGKKPQTHEAMTLDLLKDAGTLVYFPLCWQACMVGSPQPFSSDIQPFEQSNLSNVRYIITQLAPEYVISPHRLDDIRISGRSYPGVLKKG